MCALALLILPRRLILSLLLSVSSGLPCVVSPSSFLLPSLVPPPPLSASQPPLWPYLLQPVPPPVAPYPSRVPRVPAPRHGLPFCGQRGGARGGERATTVPAAARAATRRHSPLCACRRRRRALPCRRHAQPSCVPALPPREPHIRGDLPVRAHGGGPACHRRPDGSCSPPRRVRGATQRGGGYTRGGAAGAGRTGPPGAVVGGRHGGNRRRCAWHVRVVGLVPGAPVGSRGGDGAWLQWRRRWGGRHEGHCPPGRLVLSCACRRRPRCCGAAQAAAGGGTAAVAATAATTAAAAATSRHAREVPAGGGGGKCCGSSGTDA